MALRHEFGRWGEGIAADYLEARGWTVRGRNVRVGVRELDLVVQRKDLVAFVEVKTRGRGRGGHLEAVDRRKRRDIRAAAAGWIRAHGRGRFRYRFDVIGVTPAAAGPPIVEHVENAWQDW